MSTPASQQPSPQLFFQTMNAHQRTEALKAGIELDVFTAIGEGNTTVAEIAKRCHASEKGTRVLCDYLTIMEMLTKQGDRYGLTLDSSVFLDKRSPAYLGGAVEFLSDPKLTGGAKYMAEAVRKGGTAMPDDGTIGPDNPIWVTFARAMAAEPDLHDTGRASGQGPGAVADSACNICIGLRHQEVFEHRD